MNVIGLAVGRGTGTQVAAVFERVLERCGELNSTDIGVVRSPWIYHSYVSLKDECAVAAEGGVEQIRQLTQQDAEHDEGFCRAQAELGVRAIFRTAITAQSRYLVRQRLQAVKVDVIGRAST